MIIQMLQTPKTRTVAGVDILSVGTHNSANAGPVEFTSEDIDTALANLTGEKTGNVPVKVGHSTDEFNLKLAEAIGQPVETLVGEDGRGQLSLGSVGNATRNGDMLVVDLLNVPEAIADMINMDGSGFITVSPEIVDDEELGIMVVGLALLGAEPPAVEDQRGLDAANVFTKTLKGIFSKFKGKTPAKFHTATERLESIRWMATNIGLTDEATIPEIIARLQEIEGELGNPESPTGDDLAMDERLLEALGLDAEADMDAVIAAINVLKSAQASNGDGGSGSGSNDGDMAGRLAAAETEIAALTKGKRISHFSAMAQNWGHLGKTPDAIGEELATLELNAGKVTIDQVVAGYDLAANALKAAGATKTFSRAADSDLRKESKVDKITAYQKDNPGVSYGDAFTIVSKQEARNGN